MKISVVTYNIRCDVKDDGINYFFNRAYYVLKKIKSKLPDVIGFQETTDKISDFLKTNLPEYTFVGLGRNSDLRGESNLVAFRSDKFGALSTDQFWLSPTPMTPGSRYEDQSLCPRICVSLVLNIKGTGTLFRMYNTHLDHISEYARTLGMDSIIKRLLSDKEILDLPLILTGDMNATPNAECIVNVTSVKELPLIDAASSLADTFHGYGKTGGKIDYIFVNENTKIISTEKWDDVFDGIYLSDHYPLEAVIEI